MSFQSTIDQQTRKYNTPYDVQEISTENLKKMSVGQRLQYATDMQTERQYRQSTGLAKGLLSGATLGISENIEALKPNEGDFLVGLGETIGSALPISKLANVLGKPLIKLAASSPVMANGIKSLAKITGMGLTGAAYEGAKETVKKGELPSLLDVAKYGASWSAIDAALSVTGKIPYFIKGLKNLSKEKGISSKKYLNEITEDLNYRKINPTENPKLAAEVAEKSVEDAIHGRPIGLPEEASLDIYRGYGRENRESIYRGSNSSPILGEGKYYAFDESQAKTFGPNIEKRKINFKNPKMIRSDNEWKSFARESGLEYANPKGMNPEDTAANLKKISDKIKESDNDAVIVFWNNKTMSDTDSYGNEIKTLRNVFSIPQVFVPKK